MSESIEAASSKTPVEVAKRGSEERLPTQRDLATKGAASADEVDSIRDWKKPAILGYVIIIFTFVVLGGWSAVAKLDSAVTASGIVAVENSRKSVQHLEGGIVEAILVQEGQSVHEGQVLFKLAPTQAQASLELQTNQLDDVLAQEVRLVAERDHAKEITWPEEILSRADLPLVKQAMSDQTKQFNEEQASLNGQIDVFRSKIGEYNNQIEGLQVEREATNRQLRFIVQELTDLNYLLQENLVQKSRVLALEREKARLEGVIGTSTAEEAKARTAIGGAELDIQQARNKFNEQVASSILDVRKKISDAREKVHVAQDVFKRLDITAPVSGTVQNLKVFTLGGVIKPGETLLEIVPDHEVLIVQAHVAPQDMDRMEVGMRAEVRFPAFKTSILPIISGRVQSVSRDRMVDEQNKQPYFLAQVVATDIPDEIRDRLVAGMPAELIFPTGERTVLNYLVRPLRDRMTGAFRER
jgi:HlyD family type I secretion membrane fusion protein